MRNNRIANLGSPLAQAGIIVCFVLAFSWIAVAQQKNAPAKSDLTGRYEGSAKNGQGEVISLTLELTEKEGAVSGMIRSSHGDFAISSGSHKEDAVTLEFDAEGTSGTISLHANGDQLTGTWTAGDDGGPVDVKKTAAQQDKPSGL